MQSPYVFTEVKGDKGKNMRVLSKGGSLHLRIRHAGKFHGLRLFRRFFDLGHVHLDDGGWFVSHPFGLSGLFGPGKGKVEHFSRIPRFFKYGKRFKQHGPLAFPVPDVADRAPKGIFNRSYPRDAHSPMILRDHGKHNRGKSRSLKKPRYQPHGLATKRSGRGQKYRLNPFFLHARGDSGHGLFE